jgi:hypothetical protein
LVDAFLVETLGSPLLSVMNSLRLTCAKPDVQMNENERKGICSLGNISSSRCAYEVACILIRWSHPTIAAN